MMAEESWRPVVGFEGIYEVSDYGNVRALDRVMPSGRWGFCTRKGGLMKAKLNKRGYFVIGLRANGSRKWKGVSQLVCEAFHGGRPSPAHQAAHFPDPNPQNNRASNLRWATSLENHGDRAVHGTLLKGVRNAAAILTDDQVRAIRAEYTPGRSRHPGNQAALSARFGVCPAHIQNIANGRGWEHVL